MNRPLAAKSPRRNFSLSRFFSDEGLTKKAYLNAFAAGLDYFVRIAVAFIMNPLVVDHLGDKMFGAWRWLGSVIGYVSAAGGRPTQALKWTVAHRQASEDFEEKRRNVGSAVVVGLIFVPVIAIVGGLVAWFAPALLHTPPIFDWTVRLAAFFLVFDLLVSSFVQIPQSVLQGENLGYKRMGMSTFLVFVAGGLQALVVYFGAGLVGLAVSTVIGTLLSGSIYFLVVKTYVPWYGIARPAWSEVRKFLDVSVWFLVWRLIMKLMLSSDVFILGFMINAEAITPYALTKYSGETLVSLAAIIVTGITPGLGGIIGGRDLMRARRVRGEIMILTWLLIATVGVTILCWNPTFVSLWVGRDRYAGEVSNLLIILMMLQFIMIRNDANIIDLTLDLRTKTLIGGFSCALCLALSWTFLKLGYGIPGLCLAFIIGRINLTLGYPVLIGRQLDSPLSGQILAAIRPLLASTVLFGSALAIAKQMPTIEGMPKSQAWPILVVGCAITVPVAAALAFYLGLNGEQRRSVVQRVLGAAGKRKKKGAE